MLCPGRGCFAACISYIALRATWLVRQVQLCNLTGYERLRAVWRELDGANPSRTHAQKLATYHAA